MAMLNFCKKIVKQLANQTLSNIEQSVEWDVSVSKAKPVISHPEMLNTHSNRIPNINKKAKQDIVHICFTQMARTPQQNCDRNKLTSPMSERWMQFG